MTRTGAADVVVVGGGIIGAAVALRLTDTGMRVALVDGPGPAGSATGASGAMLGVLGELSPQDPPADLELRLAAWRRYPAWARSVGWELDAGTFIIADPNRARDLDAVWMMRDAARRHGLRAESVDAGDVPATAATLRFPTASALYLPDEAWVNGPRLREAVLDAAARTGRLVRVDGRAERVLLRGEKAVGVKLSQGIDHLADETVLCAGAALPGILRDSGLPDALLPRIVSAKGVGLTLAPASGVSGFRHVLRTPNRHFACGLHLVPRDAGTVYLGSTNSIVDAAAPNTGATAGDVVRLLTAAIRELSAPLSGWNLIAAVHGSRPLPMDGTPIAGRTAVSGLSIATGTYRNGVLLAPLMAEAVRAELDGETSPAPVDLSPRRRVRAAEPVDVLRRGLAELLDYWRDEPGARSLDLLAPLVDRLAQLAFGADRISGHDGHPVSKFLRDHGRPEMVPQAVLALLAAGSADGPAAHD